MPQIIYQETYSPRLTIADIPYFGGVLVLHIYNCESQCKIGDSIFYEYGYAGDYAPCHQTEY